jgi:trans-AT polyketide synthase/acyltransferase/oxidoreductase domain-containing protein
MFPGQGSQILGMGAKLFDHFPEYVEIIDKILGYSIKELCLKDQNGLLNQTQYTQPAIFVVNALSYLKKLSDGETPPNYVLGHSLGEYNALLAAGCFDFETGLRLVQKRGELMGEAINGGMAAVLNCDKERIESILKENQLLSIDVANYNSQKQIVLSGNIKEIHKAKPFFEKEGAMYIPLNVSAAFHSRFMIEAANKFENYLKKVKFLEPQIPVIANISAREYISSTSVANSLKTQIHNSVLWMDSMYYLMSLGVEKFEEVGPSSVLSKLLKGLEREFKSLPSKYVPLPNPSDELAYKQSSKVSNHMALLSPESLGSDDFRKDYNIKYAYLTGGMAKAISSKELIVRMGKSGLMGYYGTGGVKISTIENDIQFIQSNLSHGESYGMNLLCNYNKPKAEMEVVDLFLRYGIKNIEAAAYIQLSPALIKFRLKGLLKNSKGKIESHHKVLAKVSRPEVAEVFLNPPPQEIVNQLFNDGLISIEQKEFSRHISMADDICVEADSGGHTDMGNLSVLLPSIIQHRDKICFQQKYSKTIRIGAAGGIGSCYSAASAFVLGADFILTGSVNQCSVEAGTSDHVKDLLAQLNVQDTTYAPAGDMFEIGARIQVMKKGVFFPARANKLFDLWRQNNSWEEIDSKTRQQIESKYFNRSFSEVYHECKEYYRHHSPQEIEKAEKNSKHKLALVFRWYFVHSTRLALKGDENNQVNYQIHTGPALGSFNQWVKGTELENWRNRHVDFIADKIMIATADYLNQKFEKLYSLKN